VRSSPGLIDRGNFAARFFASMLIFFVIATTFYFRISGTSRPPEKCHDAERRPDELSIIGARS